MTERRRMLATMCMALGMQDSCPHEREHDEIIEGDKPEPDYKETCAEHGCKPAPTTEVRDGE